MNFEELWNTPLIEGADRVDPAIFASMQPRRVPFEVASLSDARMVEAYKKAHSWNSSEAANDLEMIKTKEICRKCLLHVKVCREFGKSLKQYEIEQYKAEKQKREDKKKEEEAEQHKAEKQKRKANK
ncbi:uncharacterized protein LOC132798635 [Drosophila nasuta]|uniref:uncharacterized protein LOC132798635 n=1 Tax=Drosophila nasuta TaxID=42062 RepID=UPI00295E9918|nr:uncharacterized protein LOC132798635 [Drosophila nasuta]